MEVSLYNKASEIPLAHQALDRFAADHALPGKVVRALHLALEEHLTNVVTYGYRLGQAGHIRVRYALEANILSLEVEDDAQPFNPTKAPEVDTSLPLDAKPLGGLGLLMIRKSVDELKYRREDHRNILIMLKRLSEA